MHARGLASSSAACSCPCRRPLPLVQRSRAWKSVARVNVTSVRLSALDSAPDIPQDAGRDPREGWQRLQLLARQQELAVAEENYSLAAQLRDEVRAQMNALPPVQQYLYRQVSILRSGDLVERLQAIKAMVEAGDDVVVPELAKCLHDKDLMDIAYEAMWKLFMRHPDPEVNELMIQGIGFMSSPATVDKALAVFNDIIRRAPTFPEGYNKRATVLYQMKRFDESIADCRTVLRMQPWHFGAASGMGLCYLNLSREKEAVESFELALTIHPGMADIARVCSQLRKRLPKTDADTQPPPQSSSGDPSSAQ